jgi:hypothetical protein
MDDIAALIQNYGFPIIAVFGLGYFIYFIWKWVTEEVAPVIGTAQTTLIDLIDRVRMLDNDLIRLNQKLNTILQLREEQERQKGKDSTSK